MLLPQKTKQKKTIVELCIMVQTKWALEKNNEFVLECTVYYF